MYRTGSPYTVVEDFNTTDEDIVFGPINGIRLNDCHRFDASLLYRFNFSNSIAKQFVLGLSFQNIYSRQVPLSVFYRVDGGVNDGEFELNRIRTTFFGFCAKCDT